MARVSRRNQNNNGRNQQIPEVQIVSESVKVATAAYARLSSEEEQAETVSTQVELLREFISNSNELELTDVYIDNGYTGTNFDRPDFSRMMSDIQRGKIHCIVVKDLSRFGRNFLETGYYIETLLPKLNVRLIAINDNFDSSRTEDRVSISVPIKNMVNELYAKDISRKICASNESRRKNGTFTIGHSVYGYSVDREANKYVVNPETAPVVQLIFHWLGKGVGITDVADRLNSLGIITPLEYKCLNEFHKDPAEGCAWNTNRIKALISKEVYTGDRCLGVRQAAAYKGQDEIYMPRSEWTIYENNHEPLVTREDYEMVMDVFKRNSDRRRAKSELLRILNPAIEPIFSGRIVCAKCGRILEHRIRRADEDTYDRENIDYICKEKYYSDGKRNCNIRIREDQLTITVLDSLRLLTSIVLEQDELLKRLRRYGNDRNPATKLKNKINDLERRDDNCSEKISRLYEDLTAGIIDQDDYKSLRAKYQNEREEIRKRISETKEEITAAEQGLEKFETLVNEVSELPDDFTITPELVEHFIDRIIAHENGKIEIVFKCDDVLQQITAITGGSK